MPRDLTAHGSSDDRETLLLSAQLELVVGVAAGEPLTQALDALLQVVEKVSEDGMLASVLLLDDSGRRLVHGSAPSLPADYNDAIDGIEIGAGMGSCGTAAHSRRQVIVADIDSDPLWKDFRDLALSAGLRACWSTPIIGNGGRLLGTFAMYYPAPATPVPADLALIDLLVRSVASAIDRSRLDRERERALAEERALGLTFQESLLPDIPERIAGVDLVARYRTGDPGVHVGGDWFDAIEVDGGVVLVVGDVEGHDARAAALMGQLRTVVRVAAMESHPPAVILARAADYLELLDAQRLATTLVLHVDLESSSVRAASAGHPPALVMKRDTPWPVIDDLHIEPGPPLGIGTDWPERTTHVDAGDTLLLFTDGLVEMRGYDLDETTAQLKASLAALPVEAATSQVLQTALELLPPGKRGDDVAVLAAVLPADVGASGIAERWLPSRSSSVPQVRAWAREWLTHSPIPADTYDAALLAISELVTNAVRQETERIRVTLSTQDDALLVQVFDHGHRTPAVKSVSTDSTGGRGLHLVEAFCDDWGVDEESDGKTVWARLDW